ncbi:MAG: hypothetical protein CME31_11655 [Gimesia sp.]|jgi:hypothetical protein|nr:hypothetical protein [Gimesia sp.]|tara:strand:+ start:183 stop:872 length:690 start_codon:yes stop_codon:yes gene_type:complete
MALSDITLKQIRSDLQSRLDDVAPNKFGKEELNYWINMSQFDVAMRLSVISNIWYGTTQTVSVTASANAITTVSLTGNYAPTKIMKIVKWVLSNNTVIPFVEDTKLHTMLANSNYDSSYAANWFGESLYVFVGTSATALSANSTTLYFLRKPDEMTTDAGTLDAPTEYYDIIVLSAMAKAMSKVNMMANKATAERDVAAKLNEVRTLYGLEAQVEAAEEAVGVQTPRLR